MKTTETFLYNEKFYSDISDLMDALDMKKSDLDTLPNDWQVEVENCDLEPMFQLDADGLSETISSCYEDRFDEDGSQAEDITKALEQCVDFDKLNSLIPSLWYPNGKKVAVTKNDLIEYCS